jgi:hypothetical protein
MVRAKPTSVGEHIKTEAAAGDGQWDVSERRVLEQRDYGKFEEWTRVSPRDYEKNSREMISLARSRNAGVVLLFNELWVGSPYRALLRKLSAAEGVPLVDSSALIEHGRRRVEEELEATLELRPASARGPMPGGEVEVVFRVYVGERPVPRAIYIVGAHPKRGDLVPNTVAMYDDGTHGDQRAGDHVWSYATTFPPGAKLFYVYTNSGETGKWEGLDVPYIRAFKVQAEDNAQKVYRPIESFGKIYLQADGWHTDAAGYDMIAKALLDQLKRNEKVQRYLRRAVLAAALSSHLRMLPSLESSRH